MKKITLLLGLLIGLNLSAQNDINFDTSDPNWVTFMNVYEQDGTTLAFAQPNWGITDLVALIDQPNSGDVTLKPNRVQDTDPFWQTGSSSGNKIMDANLYIQDNTLNGSVFTFNANVDINTLNNTGMTGALTNDFTVTAFIKVFETDYSSVLASDIIDLRATSGNFTLSMDASGYTGKNIQYGFQFIGPNVGWIAGGSGDGSTYQSLYDNLGGIVVTPPVCEAAAGTLSADATPVQLSGADVTISATEGTAPTVPTNYDVAYVLTSGPTLIIEQIGATPSFDVTMAGDYTIHTLVAELSDMADPNYLDTSGIVFGTTTGVDVLGIVTGAGLCAALDVTGSPITVEDCTADAGTLIADATPVQLAGSSVTISATEGTAPTVPTNYDVAYVLTSGPTLIIEQIGATPSFDVTMAGDYTIHTLVAELSDMADPNYLDTSGIVFGTTTGVDVLGIVTGAGLCAALDVTGSPITVEACSAAAGTLTADTTPIQLSGADVTISATEGTAPTVPTDYEVVYVLTSGASLIIEQIGASPSFDVTMAGDYTIHTLVAELSDMADPNYLDTSGIVFGITTGVDVLGIVTGAGLCAALDVTGAPITVEACSAAAGTLTADANPVDLAGNVSVNISATEGTAPTVPTNYEVAYVLTSGPTLIIEQTAATPEFVVDAAGDYTIHTLVAELSDINDPNYLDLSVVVPGTTTGGDVLGIVTGAGLCAALDVTGSPITVINTLSLEDNSLFDSIKVYPNPMRDYLFINNNYNLNIESVNMYDISGRQIKSDKIANNASEIRLDISQLSDGMYIMIINTESGQYKKQLIKK